MHYDAVVHVHDSPYNGESGVLYGNQGALNSANVGTSPTTRQFGRGRLSIGWNRHGHDDDRAK